MTARNPRAVRTIRRMVDDSRGTWTQNVFNVRGSAATITVTGTFEHASCSENTATAGEFTIGELTRDACQEYRFIALAIHDIRRVQPANGDWCR